MNRSGGTGSRGAERIRAGLLPLLLAAQAACGGDGGPDSAIRVAERDSAGVTLVRITGSVADLPVWGLPEPPVTEVRSDAAPWLGSVGEVEILADGGLLVEDNQTDELRRFTSSGDEAALLGGPGEGPGEFQNLTELGLAAGDTAFAYDRRLYRISRFDPDGTLGATIPVGRERAGPGSLVLDAWGLDSRRLVLHSLGPVADEWDGVRAYRDRRDAVIHLVDDEGRALGPSIRFPGGYSIAGAFGDLRAPLANEPMVSVRGGRILHGSGLRYELVLRGDDVRPIRIIRWDGWRAPLSDTLVRRVRDSLELAFEPARERRPELVSQLLDALFDPELLPDTLPALRSAILDDGGRIWVSAFRPTTDAWSQETTWHVLDSLGTPMARVLLPPRARLVAVRGNRVALVQRDAVDVEHVRVFELVGPGEAG